MAKKKKKIDVSGGDAAGFGNVFGDLLAAKGLAPEEPVTPSPAAPAQDKASFEWSAQPRLRVRLQKKGRGGKKVTRIEGVSFTDAAGRTAAKALGKALGCRGFVEDGEIVLQGDQRQRLVTHLTAQGVKRVDPC